VVDKAIKAGGLQYITTIDCYIRSSIISGLWYLSIRPFAVDEWDTFPPNIFIDDNDSHSSYLDHINADDDD